MASCGAFKKWGESITDLSFGESLEELRKFPAHTSYTLCTVSSKECIWAFKEAFGFDLDNNSVQAIGVSRTDFFFKEENRVKALKISIRIARTHSIKKSCSMPRPIVGTPIRLISPKSWI